MDAIIVISTADRLRQYVLEQAGDSVEKSYNEQSQSQPNTSFSTNNGRLPCKEIFFIPCPELSKTADKWVFRKFVSEAVQLIVNEKKIIIRSIASLAVGCGLNGCDPSFVAETLMRAVAYELKQRPNLPLSVYFVIQSSQLTGFNVFEEQLKKIKSY